MRSSGYFVEPHDRLRVEELDANRWRLTSTLIYRSDRFGELTVGPGFVTDFSSIPPWLPIAYVALKGVGRRAAVLHDAAYGGAWPELARADADALFAEALEALKVRPWRRWVLWLGVR